MKYNGWVEMFLLLIAGSVHLWIAPEHFSHAPAHGLFFAGVGLAQVVWSLSHFVEQDRFQWLRFVVGVGLSGGIIILWALTHWFQTPFSMESHPIDGFVWVTKLSEFIAFMVLLHTNSLLPITIYPHYRIQTIYLIAMSISISCGLVIWFGGLVSSSWLPQSSHHQHSDHTHDNFTPTRPTTSAYFTIINSDDRTDALLSISASDMNVRLHTVNQNVLQTQGVILNPHTRVDFSPSGNSIILDDLPKELYEGDVLILNLNFSSGKVIPVEFTTRMDTPSSRINFVNTKDFQISNAWIQATASLDGLVQLSSGNYVWTLPQGFPIPSVPENNPMTVEKVELGRYLFYDVRLSGNGTQSCSSCHLQALAFTDGQIRSIGATGDVHPRNSLSLANVAYNSTLTWANPNLTILERQIPIPMFGEHPVELGITGNEELVLDRFRKDVNYRSLFVAAYPEQDDPFTFSNVTRALATFTRTLISGNSPYDHYLRGEVEALSDSARRGMDLFFSEGLECHHCHTGFNFTLSTITATSTFEGSSFFNTGLYNLNGEGAYPSENMGVYEITHVDADMGRFRPPTLRNIALTAPYMHDGSMMNLEEVIEFYKNGGRVIGSGELAGDGRKNPYKSGLVAGFYLTDSETADLIAYLHSLTDEEFTTDSRFSNPFID